MLVPIAAELEKGHGNMSQNKALPTLASFSNDVGIHFTDWTDDEVEASLKVEPRHLNRNGTVHGGVVMTLLDTACSSIGYKLVDGEVVGRVVIVSLTVNFIKSVSTGTIRARARKTGAGRKMFMMLAEAFDEAGNVIATASGVGRMIADKES